MFAYLAFIAAVVLFCLAVRNGREHSLHDLLFKRMPGSNHLALALAFAVLAFFIK